jgi:hypothetical protein
MMSHVLIPTGRWKVEAESANAQGTIRLTGRAFAGSGPTQQQLQTVLLTREQARELVSELCAALHQLDVHRLAALARVAENEGPWGQ